MKRVANIVETLAVCLLLFVAVAVAFWADNKWGVGRRDRDIKNLKFQMDELVVNIKLLDAAVRRITPEARMELGVSFDGSNYAPVPYGIVPFGYTNYLIWITHSNRASR